MSSEKRTSSPVRQSGEKRPSREDYIAEAFLDAVAARVKPAWAAARQCEIDYHPESHTCLRLQSHAEKTTRVLRRIWNRHCNREYYMFRHLAVQRPVDNDALKMSDDKLWKCIDARFYKFANPTSPIEINAALNEIRAARSGQPSPAAAEAH